MTSIVTEPFTTQFQLLTTLRKRPFENIIGKGENADNPSQCRLVKSLINTLSNYKIPDQSKMKALANNNSYEQSP